MIAELLNKLRALGRALQQTGYDVHLQRRFSTFLPNLSPSELQSLQRSFLSRLSPSSFQLVRVAVNDLPEVRRTAVTKVVCDPWAGIGAVVAAVRQSLQLEHAITRNQSDLTAGKY